jgi:hypothetical protein
MLCHNEAVSYSHCASLSGVDEQQPIILYKYIYGIVIQLFFLQLNKNEKKKKEKHCEKKKKKKRRKKISNSYTPEGFFAGFNGL